MSVMNKSLFALIFSLALLPLFGALPEIAHARHGFKVVRVDDLPDVKGRMWRMEHLRNGAELVWLERDDDNMTFAIAFKTVPDDDTGVAHIMEHSVLCGSRKFPVREPFVELLKSSMATFLNAMTSPDVTVYPVATRNKKDYLNLADVYLAKIESLCKTMKGDNQPSRYRYIETSLKSFSPEVTYRDARPATSFDHDLAWTFLLKRLGIGEDSTPPEISALGDAFVAHFGDADDAKDFAREYPGRKDVAELVAAKDWPRLADKIKEELS